MPFENKMTMKSYINRPLVVFFVLLFSAFFCYSKSITVNDKKVKITYIANEGFLIQSGNKSILTDALFGENKLVFCDIPDSIQIKNMKEASGRFAHVDIVTASHHHVDHFHAPFVESHLLNNPSAQFISTQQAITKLTKTENYHIFKNRAISITPQMLSFVDTIINGIGLKVYRLEHGPYYIQDPETGIKTNKHHDVQNLGFLFTLNGIKIFHGGDSGAACLADYEHFHLEKENIDIALVSRGFMWSTESSGIPILQKLINPGHIILMHIQNDRNSKFRAVADSLQEIFPDVTVFNNKMDSRVFTFPKN